MSKKEYSLDNISNAGVSWLYTGGASLFLPAILQRFLSDPIEQLLANKSAAGTLIKPLEDLIARIIEVGGKLVRQDHERNYVFLWEDSFLEIDYTKKTKACTVSGYYLDPKIGELISEIENNFITKIKKNLIFSIIQTAGGLEARSMGDGSSPLIEENYHPKVITDLNFVLESFRKTPPQGRICILNGDPGTGKTHLIRSMLMQLDCVFLIVPSNLIDSMDKPNFMPLLMSVRDNYEKPIVMVIEDGDTCLVPRGNDNISAIASLLNLSDGILGSIMDIRMIISTNADIKQIDAAISRPGRLCKQIYVGPLEYEQANKVYQRLMKDTSVILEQRRLYTLAEIYDIVNNKDAIVDPSPPPRRIIGFAPRYHGENAILNKKE